LKKRNLISNSLIKSIVGFMAKWDVDAYRAVVETHIIEESRLADILSDEFKLTRVARLRSRPVDLKALEFLSYASAVATDILPYAIDQDGRLQVAIADPSRSECIKKLEERYGRPLVLHVAERSEIQSSIQRYYPLSMQLPNTISSSMENGCDSTT
jgi:hypothetical protein